MVQNVPRWGRLVAPAVVVFVAASSIAVAVLAARMSDRQERKLLTERASELAAILTLSTSDSRAVLVVAGSVGSSSSGTRTFESATARSVLAGSTVAVARSDRASFTVLRSAGKQAPAAGSLVAPAVATVLARARGAKDLVSGVVDLAGTKHVVLALEASGKPGQVTYLDSVLAPAQPTPPEPGSPFHELDVALYASGTVDPAQLVLVSGKVPGVSGEVVTKQFQIGVDTWSVSVSAREPLIGTGAVAFPWLIGGAGLLTAAMIGLLIEAQRRRREYALGLVREAQQEAEEANRAREIFFASVSHDIRTPLTAIMGFTEMISTAEPEQAEEFVQRVRSNVATLGVMIDNMLDHAKVQTGALEVALEPLCLKEQVDRCLEDLDPVLVSHKVAVHGTPVSVLADRHALRRILANVLVNAARYSPAGTAIDVDLSADQHSGRVSVADHGRGFDADDLEAVFSEFVRGSRATADGGTGLGLYSVHQLIEAQSGTVWIDSEPGQGATVTIELPRVPG